MSLKSKGAAAERELLHMLCDSGFSCVRVAGSGSTPELSCDLLAGNDIAKYAIECKTSKKMTKYLEQAQMNELMIFAKRFGLTPLVAIKFNRQGWNFITPDKLDKTEKNFVISLEEIKKRGCDFKQLIECS